MAPCEDTSCNSYQKCKVVGGEHFCYSGHCPFRCADFENATNGVVIRDNIVCQKTDAYGEFLVDEINLVYVLKTSRLYTPMQINCTEIPSHCFYT